VDRDRGIGACQNGASSGDASGKLPARIPWIAGVKMDAGTFLGVDIGKRGHYALAVDASEDDYQTPAANDEAALRKLVVWAHEHTVAGSASWSQP
jgi:hypothetical protein